MIKFCYALCGMSLSQDALTDALSNGAAFKAPQAMTAMKKISPGGRGILQTTREDSLKARPWGCGDGGNKPQFKKKLTPMSKEPHLKPFGSPLRKVPPPLLTIWLTLGSLKPLSNLPLTKHKNMKPCHLKHIQT